MSGPAAPGLTGKIPAGQIQIREYFPTVVLVGSIAGAERLNAALSALILARAAADPGTAHSNLGGWQSSWDFDGWGGPAWAEVIGEVRQVIDRFTSDRAGRPVRPPWKRNAWANVNRSGHGNEFHTHPGAFWSGVYYVQDGGAADDPALGGELELADPRGVAPAMYAPALCIATPSSLSMGASELIGPRAGMFVLFPSFLSHGVRPYRGTRTRISIAFNFNL